MPDLAECQSIKKCKLKRDCEGDKMFTDPKCCPSLYCNPICIEKPEECDPNPP